MADKYGMVQKPALVAPRLPVPQQAGEEWGDLGPKGHFWNNAEEYWEPTFEAIDNIWNTYGTLPVHRKKYLPEDLNFIAESGRSANFLNDNVGTEGDNYYGTFGFENSPDWRPTDNLGMYLDVPFGQWQEGLNVGYALDDRLDRPTVAISDLGWEAMQPGLDIISNPDVDPQHFLPHSSVGMHELGGHYYDNVIAGQDQLAASDIMNSYGNLTQEELYEQWMNDPRTAHLDIEDPTDRIHHSGRNNPREGFGQYISTALADPGYQTIWNLPDREGFASEEDFNMATNYSKYRLEPAEKLARAVGASFRPQFEEEGHSTITPELNRIYANSLATFLNSR